MGMQKKKKKNATKMQHAHFIINYQLFLSEITVVNNVFV